MRAAVLTFALLATPAIASAHIMPEGQGSGRIVGNRAYILLSIPASTLSTFDDDRDGLLSRAELGRHGREIEVALTRRVRFFDDTTPARVLWQTLSIEHADDPDAPMSSITLVRVAEWDHAPARPRLVTDVFAGPNATIEFRAILGEKNDRVDVDTLTATRNDVVFFEPAGPRLAAADYGLAVATLGVAVAGWLAVRRRSALTVNTASRSA